MKIKSIPTASARRVCIAALLLSGLLASNAQGNPRTQLFGSILKPILQPILAPVTEVNVLVNGSLLNDLLLDNLLGGLLSGSSLNLQAQPSGVNLPNVQWLLNGDPIPGANQAQLSIPNFGLADGGVYQVVYFGKDGLVESDPVPVQAASPWLDFADAFANRGLIQGFAGAGRSLIDGANAEAVEPGTGLSSLTQSMWISWTAPADGLAALSTAGSQFDTVLSVFESPTGLIEDLIPVAEDDDGSDYHTSLARFNAVEGVQYAIRVSGFEQQSSGAFVLQWALDTAADLLPVILTQPESVTLQRGDNLFLSVTLDSPLPVSLQWLVDGVPIPGANDSILSIQNIRDGDVGQYRLQIQAANISLLSEPAEVQINTQGWDFLLRDKLEQAIADRFTTLGAASKQSRVESSKSNARASMIKQRSAGVLTKRPRGSKVFSDARIASLSGGKGAPGVGARGVQGYSGTQVFSTNGGSNDPDEPRHCNIPGGSSYWLCWQAPNNGTMFMDTDGSSYDTTLTVYTINNYGYGYASLQRVSCNDDRTSYSQTSRIRFSAYRDVTYMIVVDGYNGARGQAYLNYYLSSY